MTSVRRSTAAVLAVLVAAGVAACSSSKKAGDLPTMASVRDVLARHTQAVLAHSSAAFLADVDTAPQAAAFRAQQAEEISALGTVPLSGWEYSVEQPVSDPGATSVATTRYGTPAVIVRIAVSYRFTGIDTTSSSHDVWWTFVRRGGRTVIAGNDDLAGSGGAGWVAPWDFGPISVARGSASLVLGHPASAASLSRIAAAVDAAIPVVSGVVGTDWPRKVAVFVPSSAPEFSALSGGVASTDTAAVTVFDDPGSSPIARVLVRPDVLKTLSPIGLQITLRHEITHAATATTTSPITPRWLIEGLAEYVGNLDSGQSVPTAAAELAKTVRAGTLPTRLPQDSDFGATGASLDNVYEESWLACDFIVSRIGPHGLADLYVSVGRSAAPNDTAFALEAKARLGVTLSQFIAQWRGYLTAQLG